MERVRISGKDLGALALGAACPRCFWVSRKAPGGLPYQIFPGIFSSIDSYTKKIVHGWFDRNGAAPTWLGELGVLRAYIDPPHFSKFQMIDESTNILLTGAPDAIFVREDGSHLIGDYKTARFTKNQDSLLPVYEVQLNSYALIAEAVGISPVSAIALIYAEPRTEQADADRKESHDASGFSMGFAAKIKPLDLNPGMSRPLLERTREILDKPEPPLARGGCKECAKLDGLIGLLSADSR
ncbi:MAG: PD-(D/E)XK nuclease family protein [Fimbriimonadaceae bacterium]